MTIIKVPDELAHEIDRLAGAKQRSAYAVEVLWREVRRNRQREALRSSAGSWKPEDHPELERGGAARVEEIRSEPDERFENASTRAAAGNVLKLAITEFGRRLQHSV